jgi:hypothetical protein
VDPFKRSIIWVRLRRHIHTPLEFRSEAPITALTIGSKILILVSQHSSWHFPMKNSVIPLLSPSSPGTVFMFGHFGETDAFIIGLYLEGFLFGKIFNLHPCESSPIIPRSRTLYWNIRLVFETRIEKVRVQGGHHPLCSLSSLRPICCYVSWWFSKFHYFSKQHFSLSELNINFYQIFSRLHHRLKFKWTYSVACGFSKPQ